jgi:hypothetical protein
MDWKDIAEVVGKTAPMLGTLLGGPAGAAVGGIISAALGANGTPDEVATIVANDPAAAVKLREIEATNRERLSSLTVQAEANRLAAQTEALRIAAADRQDARKSGAGSRIPGALAIGVTLGFFGVLATMLANVWKPSDNQALLILLGALGTSWGAVVNYYFGSSAGSARKDEILASR